MKLFKVAMSPYYKLLLFECNNKHCYFIDSKNQHKESYFGEEPHSWNNHIGTYYL